MKKTDNILDGRKKIEKNLNVVLKLKCKTAEHQTRAVPGTEEGHGASCSSREGVGALNQMLSGFIGALSALFVLK